MKVRYLVGGIILVVLLSTAILLIQNPAPLPAADTYATNGPLAGAYEMAVFIDRVRDSVSHQEFPARDHLKGIQAVFFISDYVMASKTNRHLAMTKSAITGAFTNVSSDASHVADRLQLWAERSGTLFDHYRGINEIPTEKTNIAAVEAAMTDNGVPIDTQSDLLMDCIRYVVQITDIEEAYGPNPKQTPPTPSPATMDALMNASDSVFRHRFEMKFGLKPEITSNLMAQLKQVRLHDLSPADVEIPAPVHIQ